MYIEPQESPASKWCLLHAAYGLVALVVFLVARFKLEVRDEFWHPMVMPNLVIILAWPVWLILLPVLAIPRKHTFWLSLISSLLLWPIPALLFLTFHGNHYQC